MTTGAVAASRPKNVRQAANSSSVAIPGPLRSSTPSRTRSADSTHARSSASGTCRSRVDLTLARVVAGSSVSASSQRLRTISPSAQNVRPPPKAGHRPSCHQTSSIRPSTYLRNSQARRDLPIPAGPVTDTRRRRPSRLVAWNRSLSRRSSSARPVNGASRPSLRLRPPRSATTRRARQAGTGLALPLSARSPTCSKAIAPPAARRVASPTSTVPGFAADCSRAAVLTMSPATIPWFTAPSVTAASPVSTPARASMPWPRTATASTSSSAARTARSASSSWATGLPQTAMTASPMNFSMTPPYRPTTSWARSKYRPRVSRTSSLSRPSAKGVKPTRSAKRMLTRRRSAAGSPIVDPPATTAPALDPSGAPQSPQKRLPGGFGAPQAAQFDARVEPQSPQKRFSGGFSAPHAGQVIGHLVAGQGRDRPRRSRGGERIEWREPAPAQGPHPRPSPWRGASPRAEYATALPSTARRVPGTTSHEGPSGSR